MCYRVVVTEFRAPLLDPWNYFARCPSCRRDGELRGVGLRNRQKTFTYWCPDCQQSWDVSGPHDERWRDVGSSAESPASPNAPK